MAVNGIFPPDRFTWPEDIAICLFIMDIALYHPGLRKRLFLMKINCLKLKKERISCPASG